MKMTSKFFEKADFLKPNSEPFLKNVVNVCTLFPLMWILVFGSFIWRVKVGYGHWLSSRDPVSEVFHFPMHDSLIVLTTILAIFSFPVWLLFVAFEISQDERKFMKRFYVLLPWLIIVAFVVLNPRGLFTWFLD